MQITARSQMLNGRYTLALCEVEFTQVDIYRLDCRDCQALKGLGYPQPMFPKAGQSFINHAGRRVDVKQVSGRYVFIYDDADKRDKWLKGWQPEQFSIIPTHAQAEVFIEQKLRNEDYKFTI